MKNIRFLGPHRTLTLGGKTLERGGDPMQITDTEFALLEDNPRWQYEEVTERAAPARARGKAARPRARGKRDETPATEPAATEEA